MSSFSIATYKKQRATRRLIMGIVLVFIVIIVGWYIMRLVLKRNAQALPYVSADTAYNTLTSKRALVHKITELQTTIHGYDAELATARLLEDENMKLKAELGRPESIRGTLAHVITLPNRSFYDTFIIDGGAGVGIHVGQHVYAFGTIALGTVTAVEDKSATVQLFSASGNTISGTAAPSDIAVTLIGRGGGEYEVRIPRDVQFSIGGVIAEQSTISAVLAQIERIVTDPRDPFQRIIAKAPVNLQALKWVIVR